MHIVIPQKSKFNRNPIIYFNRKRIIIKQLWSWTLPCVFCSFWKQHIIYIIYELRKCVNREVGLGSHSLSHSSSIPNSNKPCSFCGHKAPKVNKHGAERPQKPWGLLGTGRRGGGGVWRLGKREIIYIYNIYLSLHCHHQNDSCIKMGSNVSHFNVSVRSDGQSHKTVSTNHNLSEERGELKQYWTQVLPLTSLTPYLWAKLAHIKHHERRTIYIHSELHTHTTKHMNTNQLSISHSNVYIQWYMYTSQLVKKYDQYSLNSFPWVSLSPPQPHSHLTVVLGLTL